MFWSQPFCPNLIGSVNLNQPMMQSIQTTYHLYNPTPADTTGISFPEINIRHHANNALSRTCETKHDTPLLKTVK